MTENIRELTIDECSHVSGGDGGVTIGSGARTEDDGSATTSGTERGGGTVITSGG